MELRFSVVEARDGSEVHINEQEVIDALRAEGWTIFPPMTPEEALMLADEYADEPEHLLFASPLRPHGCPGF